MKRIKSLPQSLRPREKLLKLGSEALETAELLSIIMVTGTKKFPVNMLSKKIVSLLKNDRLPTKQQLTDLELGNSKVAQILASIELGKRLTQKRSISFNSPDIVFANSLDILNNNKESLICFYLNARGEMIKKEILAVGTLNRVNVLPREILGLIKELPIAGIILVHNHPSGNLEPSRDDILFTKRVRIACDLLGVKLLDHLIICPDGWNKIKI